MLSVAEELCYQTELVSEPRSAVCWLHDIGQVFQASPSPSVRWEYNGTHVIWVHYCEGST